MSRQYEAVYVFDSALEDSAITEKLGRFHALIGPIGEVAIDAWGRRQLAYKIGTKETGYYAVARFEAEAAGLPEYERAIRLDDSVIRHLITLHEHDLGAPPMTPEEQAAAAKRREEDEDEEE
jgi:small subunit ribosomal protein S6